MYCPNCKTEQNGKFCPECGTKLIDRPTGTDGFNINLGDANAISGGLHLADFHTVHNEDKSIHNISNTTSTVNNITNVAAQRTEIELLQERKILYLNACKRAYEDNVLEQSEKIELDRYRLELGLDEVTADNLLEQVRQMTLRSTQKTELTSVGKIKLKQFSEALEKNDMQAVLRQIDSIGALAGKFDNDELQCKYHMVLAAIRHEKCIEMFEQSKVDNYWKSFWTYLAYLKANKSGKASEVLFSLGERFPYYPEDNITLLAAAGSFVKNEKEEAHEYLNEVTGDHTPVLQRFAETVYLLLNPEMAKEMGIDEYACTFHLVNFFGQEDPKIKAEKEARRKAEEEARRKAEEEARRKAEEEERRRAEEDKRKKAEEEARMKVFEEKRRQAEAEAKEILEKRDHEKAVREKEAQEKKEARKKAREKREAEKRAREQEAAEKRAPEKENAKKSERDKIIENLISNMVYVEGGTFTMGKKKEPGVLKKCFFSVYDNSELNAWKFEAAHQVTLSSFRICRYEVTQEEWGAVMDIKPSYFWMADKHPVVNVNWEDCQIFISKLNEMTGMSFRLPTEAEWEYAARGGNKSKGYKYSGSNNIDDVAWYHNNSNRETHAVGQKRPNELGLYDMSGNVKEWCNDWYGVYHLSSQTNPKGAVDGLFRVVRGGYYDDYTSSNEDINHFCVWCRNSEHPKYKYKNLGFRLAL